VKPSLLLSLLSAVVTCVFAAGARAQDCPKLLATYLQTAGELKKERVFLKNCQRAGNCAPEVIASHQAALKSAQTNFDAARLQNASCGHSVVQQRGPSDGSGKKVLPQVAPTVLNLFVSHIRADRATIEFTTPIATPAQVALVDGAAKILSETRLDGAVIAHSVPLLHLKPDTEYPFQIIVGGVPQDADSFHTLQLPPAPAPSPIFQSPLNKAGKPLRGFVDLHTHLMNHLGFGGHMVYGAPDVGILMPAGTVPGWNWGDSGGGCNVNTDMDAASPLMAMGSCHSTHGGHDAFSNKCGDDIRHEVLNQFDIGNSSNNLSGVPNATGFPNFVNWPKHDDILHQQMWIDWIRRAHDGGLRVLVADAGNSATLAKAVMGNPPWDDKPVADKQIAQMKRLASKPANADFMEIALSAADVRRIVGQDKLALIIGVELDDIGSFVWSRSVPSAAAVRAEIKRLHDQGVRHIFPVHVVDNYFGGSAVYQDDFWRANKWQWGSFWSLQCSQPQDNINYVMKAGFDLIDDAMLGIVGVQPLPANCKQGVTNSRGLQELGKSAVREMMELGMLIDIDHMSQQTISDTFKFTGGVAGGPYPLMSSHSGPREGPTRGENSRTTEQYQELAKRGGVAGVGWGRTSPGQWGTVASSVNKLGLSIGFGSDMNGFVIQPGPESCAKVACVTYSNQFSKATFGKTKTWDFNTDGMAHIGLFPDFLRAVETQGGAAVVNTLFDGAEGFAKMWERAEAAAAKIKAAGP
jgi:microsomal dipeptidase-like Zn-dependent dipeptidase